MDNESHKAVCTIWWNATQARWVVFDFICQKHITGVGFFKGKWTMYFSSYSSNNLQEYIKGSGVVHTLSTTPTITPKNLTHSWLIYESQQWLSLLYSASWKQLPVCKSTKIQRCIYVENLNWIFLNRIFLNRIFPLPAGYHLLNYAMHETLYTKLSHSEHRKMSFSFFFCKVITRYWSQWQQYVPATAL